MPRPVSTTAPTASSASAARRAAVTSWYIAVSKALRTSGRLKAMTRTPGAASSISTRGTAIQPPLRVGRPPGAAADDGLRRTADAGGDGPADVVRQVDHDLADLVDGELAALERGVELDLEQLRSCPGRPGPRW